jgi:hypothetical protein
VIRRLKSKLAVPTANAACAPDSYYQYKCGADGYRYRRTCTYKTDCSVVCGPWYPTGGTC